MASITGSRRTEISPSSRPRPPAARPDHLARGHQTPETSLRGRDSTAGSAPCRRSSPRPRYGHLRRGGADEPNREHVPAPVERLAEDGADPRGSGKVGKHGRTITVGSRQRPSKPRVKSFTSSSRITLVVPYVVSGVSLVRSDTVSGSHSPPKPRVGAGDHDAGRRRQRPTSFEDVQPRPGLTRRKVEVLLGTGAHDRARWNTVQSSRGRQGCDRLAMCDVPATTRAAPSPSDGARAPQCRGTPSRSPRCGRKGRRPWRGREQPGEPLCEPRPPR
jgi:hypothetical protein